MYYLFVVEYNKCMRNLDFDNYILKKKLRLLYYLYERLYSYVIYNNSYDKFVVYDKDENGDGLAEVIGTQNLSIDEKIRIHTDQYRELKPKDIILGNNSQQLLIEEIWL